jgi:hypothetical protein
LFEFFDQIRRDKQKIILALVICGVIVFIDFAFVVKAQIKSTAASGKKIVVLKKDIETLTKELSVLQQDLKKSKVVAKLLKIYGEGEIPLLLQEISLKAAENNVKVMQINTSREAKGKDKSAAAKDFVSIAIRLDLACGYHNLGSFINALENSQQPVFAEEISISRDAADYLKAKVGLTLRAYVKK